MSRLLQRRLPAFNSSFTPVFHRSSVGFPYVHLATQPMSVPLMLPIVPLRRATIQAITRKLSDIRRYHYPEGTDQEGARLFRKKVKRVEKKERQEAKARDMENLGLPPGTDDGLISNPMRLAREGDAGFYRHFRSEELFELERNAEFGLSGTGPADSLLELLRGRYMERHFDRMEGRPVVLTSDIPYLYKDLVTEILKCDEVYYSPNPPDKPRVSDHIYDELVMHLVELEREYPQLIDSERSPSLRVGHCAAAQAAKLGLDIEVEDRVDGEKKTPEAGYHTYMDGINSFDKTVPIDLARPRQYRHRTPMLSLDSARNHEELAAFFRRAKLAKTPSDIAVELKIDGVALSLEYRNGSLFAASTRGSGRIGDDVTRNVIAALLDNRGVVKQIEGSNVPDWMLIRGEVYISTSDFIALNKGLERKLSNARNAASGALQHKNPEEAAKRRLRFIAYDCLCAPLADVEANDSYYHSLASRNSIDVSLETGNGSDNDSTMTEDENQPTSQVVDIAAQIQNTFETQAEALHTLEKWGFGQMPYSAVCKNLMEAEAFAKQVEEQRAELPMEIDGIVFKWNNATTRTEVGNTARAPRGSIAYKFAAQARTTTLEDVVFQVSRKGIITPVAVLSPVRVGGALLSRATLHNFDEIDRLGVMVGDRVRVERGGDVIPKIVSVLLPSEEGNDGIDLLNIDRQTKRQTIKPPTKCPSCGGEVREAEQRAKGGGRLFVCTSGEKCSAQALGRILHFAGRQAMDIQGLGSRTIQKLVDGGFLVVVADLFRLTRDDILSLDGFAKHSAENLIREIQHVRTSRSLERIFIGLGLPGIGRIGARPLALKLGSLDALIQLADPEQTNREDAVDSLLTVANVAERTAEALVDFLRCPQHLVELKTMAELVEVNSIVDEVIGDDITPGNQANGDNPIAERSFVFTGKFSSINRPNVMKWVRACGGRVMSDVSRKTDFVIFGLEPGQKLFRAQRLKVMTIDENEFFDHFAVSSDDQEKLKV